MTSLTRGCLRCDYHLCENVSTTPSSCEGQCKFGIPVKAVMRMQGPVLSSKFSAENVLTDEALGFADKGEKVWLCPDGDSSWFILDLGCIRDVGGFEMRNATCYEPDDRSTTEYTIESSVDSRSWTVVVSSKLDCVRSDLEQVACPDKLQSMRYVRFTCKGYKGKGAGLQYFSCLSRQGDPPTAYLGSTTIPRCLWDCSDLQFLDLVRCHAVVRVIALDPKTGTFALRMKCHWSFRTPKESQGSEVLLRGVPGIRMPSLIVEDVAESRLWKVLSDDMASSSTVYWEGTSTFAIEGFKIFHMERFPFDRQIINLEQLHFVWRADKNDTNFYMPMKVVSFTMETVSILSEWLTAPAYIIPIAKYTTAPEELSEPSYSSSFIVKLRIEHCHGFYIWQIFFPALLLTITSLVPLAMPPMPGDMGDRIATYGGGLLTLVVFKYGIAEHLPCVPYATFTDIYLRLQLVTVSLCMFVSPLGLHWFALPFELEESGYGEVTNWDLHMVENVAFVVTLIIWVVYFGFAYWCMPHRKYDWRDVWAQKSFNAPDLTFFEISDPHGDRGDDYRSISSGERLVTAHDSVTVWDTKGCIKLGHLEGGQVVEASGAGSAELLALRFDKEDGRLCTKQDVRERLEGRTSEQIEQYWQDGCEARVMIPIKSCGAVEWRHMRRQDADDPDVDVFHFTDDSCSAIRPYHRAVSEWESSKSNL